MKDISAAWHRVFGRFSGVAILDDGTRVGVRDLIGLAEEMRNHG